MKVSTPYIRFLYWKQVSSKEDVGGPGLVEMLGVITSRNFTVLLFLPLLFMLLVVVVPWLQSYVNLIICSNSFLQVLLFLSHNFAEHETFKNTYIDIEELPTL